MPRTISHRRSLNVSCNLLVFVAYALTKREKQAAEKTAKLRTFIIATAESLWPLGINIKGSLAP